MARKPIRKDKKKNKKVKRLPLRQNVCMFVINKKGEIFLGERLGEPGVWQLPQGGVEKEFSIEENVIRELNEELGAPVRCFQIIKRLKGRFRYLWRTPPKYAKGRWRGQSQTFWLVKFIGRNSDITLKGEPQEFSSWMWCAPSQIRLLAEPKRMKGYSAPLKEVVRCITTSSKQVAHR